MGSTVASFLLCPRILTLSVTDAQARAWLGRDVGTSLRSKRQLSHRGYGIQRVGGAGSGPSALGVSRSGDTSVSAVACYHGATGSVLRIRKRLREKRLPVRAGR